MQLFIEKCLSQIYKIFRNTKKLLLTINNNFNPLEFEGIKSSILLSNKLFT